MNLKNISIAIALVVSVVTAIVIASEVSEAGLSEFGKEGQPCYPNGTCDNPNTCWEVRDEWVCEKEIRPYYRSSMRNCYLYKNTEGEPNQAACYNSDSECLKAFTTVMDSDTIIVRGCWFE